MKWHGEILAIKVLSSFAQKLFLMQGGNDSFDDIS